MRSGFTLRNAVPRFWCGTLSASDGFGRLISHPPARGFPWCPIIAPAAAAASNSISTSPWPSSRSSTPREARSGATRLWCAAPTAKAPARCWRRSREEQRYRFDQACRVKAIELASRLFPAGQTLKLSINFLPNAVYEPAACLRATLAAARKADFPHQDIMFEFTENEAVRDTDHLRSIIAEYRRQGFTTAHRRFRRRLCGARPARAISSPTSSSSTCSSSAASTRAARAR